MEVFDAIKNRHSIRRFKDDPVCNEDIYTILDMAMHAPSACNKRPWEFYVIKNTDVLARLREVHRYSNIVAPIAIVVCGNQKRSISKRDNDFWIQDCSAAIENILLSAVGLNLGTCWNGVLPTKTAMKRVAEILSLEEDIIPLALIHIGYPDEDAKTRGGYDKNRVHEI